MFKFPDPSLYNGKTQSINNPHYKVDGLVNGEAESLLGNIAITGASGKDAGTYINKVTGENSSTKNYDIAYVDGKFVINKKKATVYALDETREYNGFSQQINSFRADGLVDGETESVLAVNAVATRKDAGNYVHAVAYSNAAKGDKNYDLTFVNGTYTITKATATIQGNSLATTYNGQVQNVAGFTISGLKGNDVNNQANIFSSVTASGASDRNAGSYTNTVAGAASTTNYNIVYENGSLDIAKKQITGSITAQDKVYDGTTNAIVNGSLNGLITGDQVNLNAQGQFVDKNAGSNKNVNVSGNLSGTDSGNYDLAANTSAQANISKKQITGVLTAQDKVYDGTTNAIVNGSLNGLITGDQVNLNAQGQFADKNAGSNKNVNVSGNLSGTDAGNYSLQANSQTQASISKKQITGVLTAQDKVYDGTTNPIVNGSLNGLITGDQVNLNAQGRFVDKNAGSNKNVNVSGNLSGTDAGNYSLQANSQTQASISKKQITGVLTAQDKVYDGTTNAIVNGSLNGLITGDQVNLNAQGQFADKNAGSNKNVNVSGNLSGTDADNYSLQANSQTQASISKKQITGVLTAQDKVYDGTTSAIVNGSLNGLITGDQVNLNAQGQFADKNAGSNKNVNVSGNLTGTDAGNYDLAANTSAQANISKKQITGVLTAQDKVYDGTTSAIVNGSLNGLITGDQVNLNAQGQFADKNAGSNKNVNVSGSLNGADAGNYSLQANSQTQANISKKQITGSITAQDKVYDGTTSAIVNGSLNGLITGDKVNLNAQGQFADKNAGSNKNVNVSGNLSGTDAGNYSLQANSQTQASIAKAKAQVIGNSLTTIYNGQQQHVTGFTAQGLVNGERAEVLTNVTATGASAISTGNHQNQVGGHDQNYDLTFTAGMLKIEAPLVDPKPPTVPEKPSQPDLSIWQDLLGNPYQRAIHFAPQAANKPKQSDSIEIEIIGDGINMDGIHTLMGNF